MKKAAFLVVPSVWYEPFGLVVAEAFACGTPVLGAFVGAIQEMLDDQVTGLHFAPGDPDALAKKVAWAWGHLPELAAMGKAARRVYENRYTANANYDLLMDIYASAIDTHTRFKRNRATSNRRLVFAFSAFRCMPCRSQESFRRSNSGSKAA